MSPLAGKRILVTRTRRQASELAVQLEALGATAILIPTIEIVPPETYASFDAALAQLDTFDWLLFTSANAVDSFAQRRDQMPQISSIHRPKIAVIGPATARAVEGIGLPVALVPPRFVAESFAEALAPQIAGCRVLLARAEEARDVLPEALSRAGAIVTIAPAYRNQTPAESIPALQALLANSANYPDAIMFTSASTARSLAALLQAAVLTLPANVALASIGPVTSEALRELGYEPTVEAAEATIPSLVEALTRHFAQGPR